MSTSEDITRCYLPIYLNGGSSPELSQLDQDVGGSCYSPRVATYLGSVQSPVGQIRVVSDGTSITSIQWGTEAPSAIPDDPLLTEAIQQLMAYFAGTLTVFDLPIDLGTQTDASRAVLMTLFDTVSSGETVTYGELAVRSGTAVPARGIGAIMGANPLPIVVPCHRVVAGDGLGGYSGGLPGRGLETKRWLLEHEGALPLALF